MTTSQPHALIRPARIASTGRLIALPPTSADPFEVETRHLAGRLRTLGAALDHAAADSGCSHSVYPCHV